MTIEAQEEQTGVKEQPSPNDNYKDNPLLDENGNPKSDATNKEPTTTEQNTDVEDKTELPEGKPEVDWTNLGNLQKLEQFLSDASLKPKDVAEAISGNNGKLTPEILKALEEKHGVGVAALLADQLQQVHADSVKAIKARDTEVFKQLEKEFEGITNQSGEETFKELKQWAETALPNKDRVELNKLLQGGGLGAQLAIAHLSSTFKEQSNIVVPAKLVSGTATVSAVMTPITRAEYTTQLRALEAKGHVYGQSEEIAKLDARRAAGLKRGI